MFKEMRRANQAMTTEENIAVLERATAGVLALSGSDNCPYAVPLSYVYHDSKIFFHGANAGHKLELIAQNSQVSFCVIDRDDIIPEEFTTHFRSVIIFGKARVLENEEKMEAFKMVAARYSPDHEEGRLKAIGQVFDRVGVVEIAIEHMTGKESMELKKQK